MMLLHLLLHVLIFHLLTAKGGQKDVAKANLQQTLQPPRDTNYVIKQVEKCDNKGFYFLNDHFPNKIEPDECFICFCQTKNTAVCWKRDNKRCQKNNIGQHGVGNGNSKNPKRKGSDTRIRRSPGFTDIFFRDASRDVFQKNTEDQQCKPYESSFSDDCPPADWCIGCTVCDCDANGRWDCHILSFCTDRNVVDSTYATKVDTKKRSLNDTTESVSVIPMSTTTDSENDYYKYILATNIIPSKINETIDISTQIDTKTNPNITHTVQKTENNKTNTVNKDTTTSVNLLKNIPFDQELNNTNLNNTEVTAISSGTENTSSVISTLNVFDDSTDTNIVPDSTPEAYNHLNQVKNMKETIKLLTKSSTNIKFILNKTEAMKDSRYKISRKDINKIKVTKKYNLLKVLNYHKCPYLDKLAKNESVTHSLSTNDKKLEKQNGLINLLNDFKNTKKKNNKYRKFTLMKYLKQIFNKIFQRNNSSKRFSRYHILETLCENYGPCKINRKDKVVLKSKLSDLEHETITILKSVKIIKGLLKLLNDAETNITLSKQSLGIDIQKLNCILRGQLNFCFKEPMTATKMTQIEYIKKNTQDFVKSVGKFAILLNEIIEIISKQKINSDNGDIQNHIIRNDPLQSLKNLLVRYDLVQNNFMKKMYDLIQGFEDKLRDKPKEAQTSGTNSEL